MRIPLSTLLIGAALVTAATQASIIFRPNEKVKYVAPGEEEVSGNAQHLYEIAQAAEKRGDNGHAIKAYSQIVKKYPHDTLAAASLYRAAELTEQRQHNYLRAAALYRGVVEMYPNSPHFDEAIDAQFRVGEMYLSGKKVKLLGIPIATSMDRAVEIFAAIVRTAPFGKYTARAQFDIGLARQKQHVNDAAIEAYQAVIDKFPNDPIAADAQYQIGYIWFEAARHGTNDQAAVEKARTAFQDYLFRYPKSEKVSQARENLEELQQKSTGDAMKIAKFYDKKKSYRAAVIYYNDVIREHPGSPASSEAQKRVDQIRAKVGPTALQPAVTITEPKKKQVVSRGSGNSRPAFRNSDAEVAPLPPPEQDSNLPPPASLSPPSTTAPEPSPAEASPAPEASATPEPSAAPDSAASPAP